MRQRHNINIIREGGIGYAELHASPIEWNDEPATLIAIRDVTARHEAELETKAAHDRVHLLGVALAQSATAILIANQDCEISWVYPAFELMSGCDSAEIVGQPMAVLADDNHQSPSFEASWAKLRSGQACHSLTVNMHKDGGFYDVDQVLTPLTAPDGSLTRVVAVYHHMTERLAHQQELDALAHEDAVTGALNRRGFVRELRGALEHAQRCHGTLAVAFFDLDHFKHINDLYGHNTGDDLLKHVAKEARAHLRATDAVARFGGDEFALLIDDVDEPGALRSNAAQCGCGAITTRWIGA